MVKKEFSTSTEELNKIRETNLKQVLSKVTADTKTTMTPFGDVYSTLKTLFHTKPIHKGEILAQWSRDKNTGKKEIFTWLGVVEKNEYNVLANKYKIYYRPFVSQFEQVSKRENQLYTNQFYGRK